MVIDICRPIAHVVRPGERTSKRALRWPCHFCRAAEQGQIVHPHLTVADPLVLLLQQRKAKSAVVKYCGHYGGNHRQYQHG
jgi:hypothetical protein